MKLGEGRDKKDMRSWRNKKNKNKENRTADQYLKYCYGTKSNLGFSLLLISTDAVPLSS